MKLSAMIKHCDICHRHCAIAEGALGFCKARKNIGGEIKNIAYGKLTAIALDPIEKKPLKHFYPGSSILSVGSFGCNMNCSFCQNHHIARSGETDSHWQELDPHSLVSLALEARAQGNIGIAFTYNEPLINYEYIIDVAQAAKNSGAANNDLNIVAVSNGQLERPYARQVFPHIHAFNIDLKAFSPGFYAKMGGDFELAKRSIELACSLAHVEISYLVIPGLNDSLEEIESAARWLAGLDREIPLHISRFFPNYKLMSVESTPVKKIKDAVRVAQRHLHNVYSANLN